MLAGFGLKKTELLRISDGPTLLPCELYDLEYGHNASRQQHPITKGSFRRLGWANVNRRIQYLIKDHFN